MGLLGWVKARGHRRDCTAVIEQHLEIERQRGTFDGDPVARAEALVASAYAQLPALKGSPYRGVVLAAVVLGVAAGEPDIKGTWLERLYGMGLVAMVIQAQQYAPRMKFAELSMLHKLQAAAAAYRGGAKAVDVPASEDVYDVNLADLLHRIDSLPTRAQRMAARAEVMRQMEEARAERVG